MHLQASSRLNRFGKVPILPLLAAILLLSVSNAFAVEITSVNIDDKLTISGTGFSSGIVAPALYINGTPIPVGSYDDSQIIAGPTFQDLKYMLGLEFIDPFYMYLTIVLISEEPVEIGGNVVMVPKVESAELCLNVLSNGMAMTCVPTPSSLVPVDRQVDWLRLPNDPEGKTFVDYRYKFGPVETNSGDNKRGDPVYYQIMDDYEINIKQYLEDYDKNNFGDIILLSECEDELDPLLDRLEGLGNSAWTDLNPAGGTTPYIYISMDGILYIKKGFRWDGPTLDFPAGTRILPKPASLVRASMVHDVIYDLMRMKLIAYDKVGKNKSKAWYNRKLADCMIYMLSRQDYNSHDKAKSDFNVIRSFGAGKTNDAVPAWKYHATADAGSYEPVTCAPDTWLAFELNGENSDDALSYQWEITDASGAVVTTASGPKPEVLLMPGNYTAALTVDDGDDGEIDALYRDTDKTCISIAADTQPPVFLLADDVSVPTDPGQCSAMVDLKVVAADDCGAPAISCVRASDNAPVPVGTGSEFPAGTTDVSCEATDVNQSTLQELQVTVTDNEPPAITGINTPIRIWPPNHKYARIRITDLVHSISDNCSTMTADDVKIVLVTSDEADDARGKGDGNTTDDIVIAPNGKSVKLRKERQGKGDGRVYIIHVEVVDDAGNTASAPFEVHVVNPKNGAAFDSGVVESRSAP